MRIRPQHAVWLLVAMAAGLALYVALPVRVAGLAFLLAPVAATAVILPAKLREPGLLSAFAGVCLVGLPIALLLCFFRDDYDGHVRTAIAEASVGCVLILGMSAAAGFLTGAAVAAQHGRHRTVSGGLVWTAAGWVLGWQAFVNYVLSNPPFVCGNCGFSYMLPLLILGLFAGPVIAGIVPLPTAAGVVVQPRQ